MPRYDITVYVAGLEFDCTVDALNEQAAKAEAVDVTGEELFSLMQVGTPHLWGADDFRVRRGTHAQPIHVQDDYINAMPDGQPVTEPTSE